MTVTITPLTPVFAGEVGAIDLRKVQDRESLEAIRDGMDKYAVLVFRDQNFTNEEQLDFAQRFDGTLHARTSSSAIGNNRFGNEALADVSNVDPDGKIREANNRMRASSVANRNASASRSASGSALRSSTGRAKVRVGVMTCTESPRCLRTRTSCPRVRETPLTCG